MSPDDDPLDVLHHLVPDDVADRVLSGGPVFEHEELVEVASLVHAARAGAGPDELVGREAALAALAAGASTPTSAIPARRTRVLPQLLTGKIVAVVASATLLSAGAAAAATGHLPDPVQRVVSSGASSVGLDLPDPRHPAPPARADADDDRDDTGSTAPTTTSATTEPTTTEATTEPTTTEPTTGATTTTATTAGPTTTAARHDDDEATEAEHEDRDEADDRGVGPDATGPAAAGLCTAWTPGGAKNTDAPPFRNLARAAQQAGQSVDDYCHAVLDGRRHGSPDSSTTTSSSPSTTADDHGNGNGKGNDGKGTSDGKDKDDHGKGRRVAP